MKLKRKNIWEVDDVFHCPIAGFCITPTEQKKIVQKFVPKQQHSVINNKMHSFIIGCISQETEIARYIQKLIDYKFNHQIHQYSKILNLHTAPEYKKLLNPENFGSFIWFLAAYMDLSDEHYQYIHDDIHDYSHYMFHELCSADRKLDSVYAQLDKLEINNNNLREGIKNKIKENKYLQTEITVLSNQNTSLNSLQNCKQTEKDNIIGLESKLGKVELLLLEKEKEIVQLKAEKKVLLKQQKSQHPILQEFHDDFKKFILQLKEQNEKCNTCNKVDLCKQRILIVGGISKICSFYKKLWMS